MYTMYAARVRLIIKKKYCTFNVWVGVCIAFVVLVRACASLQLTAASHAVCMIAGMTWVHVLY